MFALKLAVVAFVVAAIDPFRCHVCENNPILC